MSDKAVLEITPDMIEAGATVLTDHGVVGPYLSKPLAEWVYRAMFAASQSDIQDRLPREKSPRMPPQSGLSLATCKRNSGGQPS